MDACCNPGIERVTGLFSSQVVKTEILKNFIGYIIDEAPAPILMIYPTDGDARDFSSEKLEPMIKYNPMISSKVFPAKSNSKDNKTLFKKFQGGFLAIAGGRVPQDLARRSVKYVLADDRDRIGQAGDEGDAVELAWQRTESYAMLERKLIEFSTPTIEGESPIKSSYLAGDQRQFYVPCPHCNQYQILEFGGRDTDYGLKWDTDQDAFGKVIEHYPETTKYMCKNCHALIDESSKYEMLTKGKWIAKYPERVKHRSYKINRLYSLFSTWQALAEYFLSVKDKPESLQVFMNTALAETWKRDETLEIDSTGLLERNEHYLTEKNNYKIPNDVLVLTCGVDVQPDRLEYQVVGFGLQEEPWLIEYGQLYGDADQNEVYDALDEIVAKKWEREDGVELGIHYRPMYDYPIFIDSGGSNTQSVYMQCKKRQHRGWMAIKGVGGSDKPILLNVSPVGPNKDIKLQNIGVDNAKTLIHKMLAKNESPNRIHFTSAYCNQEYFDQITSEKQVKELDKRRNRFHWIWKKKSAHARNEVLDTLGYAIACFKKLNANLVVIKKRLDEKAAMVNQSGEIKKEISEQPAKKILRRSGVSRRRAS
jgi:phage terminase large subunit GpA-like protein